MIYKQMLVQINSDSFEKKYRVSLYVSCKQRGKWRYSTTDSYARHNEKANSWLHVIAALFLQAKHRVPTE